MSFDVYKVREDFPILHRTVYGQPLVYLDNAATTQKPKQVIDCTKEYLTEYNSSIHRGVHYLSEVITEEYEKARKKVQEYIHAPHSHEIIFTCGTTASINSIAFSFGERYIKEGDEILISAMEHHANIVPWQMMCQRKNAILRVIPITDNGELPADDIEKYFTPETRLLSLTHVSNVLGTINPVEKIISAAHRHDIPVLIDGAQSVQHLPVDVEKMDCDFFVFSGHKMYGPTGIGVLYGKEKWLEEIPPWQGGGDMVDIVTFEKTTYQPLPLKFEAGTTNFIGAIGLGAAIDYIGTVGLDNIGKHEHDLLEYATDRILEMDKIKIYGNAKQKSSVVSFLMDNIHQLDAGMIIDKMGVAVRTGTHCAQPLMQRYGIEGNIRASFAFYNTREEVDRLCIALQKVKDMFG